MVQESARYQITGRLRPRVYLKLSFKVLSFFKRSHLPLENPSVPAVERWVFIRLSVTEAESEGRAGAWSEGTGTALVWKSVDKV